MFVQVGEAELPCFGKSVLNEGYRALQCDFSEPYGLVVEYLHINLTISILLKG